MVNVHRYFSDMSRHRGVALVVVLWTVSLLSILAAGLSYSLRLESRLTTNDVDSAKAQALAEGGIYHGIQMLFNEEEEGRWSKDGTEYNISLAGQTVFITLQDERGKVDLNKAPEKLIQQIIENSEAGVNAQAITQAILDWRDTDHEPRPSGAEDDEYLKEEFSHGARDNVFLTVSELQQVRGVTNTLQYDVSGLFTVYSGSPGIDPLTAPLDILARLPGMDTALAQEYISARSDSFKANDNALRDILPAEAHAYLAQAGPAVYTVTARVQLPQGGDVAKSAVVHLSRKKANPYTIVAWHQATNKIIKSETDL